MSRAVRAYLSLGSNLDDRLSNLASAIAALVRDADTNDERAATIRLVGVSPVYETAAIGETGAVVSDQPSYLNCAAEIETTLPAPVLRSTTADLERRMGRGKHARFEPRIIDIDLVLYGSERIETPQLIVPHPRMLEREFVLRPLVDLNPELVDPAGVRLTDALQLVAGQGCREYVSAERFGALIGELR